MLESSFDRSQLPANYIWTLGYVGTWEGHLSAEVAAQVKSYSREWLEERSRTLNQKRLELQEKQEELRRIRAAKQREMEALNADKYRDEDAIKQTIAANPLQMLKGVAESAVNLATGGATDPKERMEICNSCPFKGDDQRCGRCGCFLPAKTRVKKSTCPIGAW